MATFSAPVFPGAPPPILNSTPTLRALLEARRLEGRPMSLAEAIAVVIPICLDLGDRHAAGEKFFVHPSSVAPGSDGLARVHAQLSAIPVLPADRACLAPEIVRSGAPGDACASVFALGAMLYEMLTTQHVGPGMRRPRDFNPELPDALEVLIGKALIGDRHHRPADLAALASAMYQLAPDAGVEVPAVSEGRLEASAELEVDVRFSVLPPSTMPPSTTANDGSAMTSIPRAPAAPRFGGEPFGAPVIDQHAAVLAARKADDPTTKLAAMKAQLEADPRPRYVVIKNLMDHGPFTAVELLQQIASHQFSGDDGLRDEITGQNFPIREWEEFAPFAEQAMLHREKRAEEKAVFVAADADKKRGLAKTIIAISALVALGGVLAIWLLTRRGTHEDNIVVADDKGGSVDVSGQVKGRRTHKGSGGGGGAAYSGGASYESILATNNQSITMGQKDGPDLTNAQLSAPLRNASFISGCGAPDDMHVTVQVAVRMGVPIGVTVRTNPPNSGVAACVDRAVRGLRWQQNGKTDFVTTNY